MSIRKMFPILVLSCLIALPVVAQDTDTPDVPTPTAVVVTATAAPTEEATAEPTPAPVPVPDPAPGGISSQVLFLVVIVVAGLVATVLLQQKSIHDALIQAGNLLPEWAWAGVKTTTITGLDALQKEAKKTIDTYDDDEVARLRKIAVDVITEIDNKRTAVAQGLQTAPSKLSS